MAWRWSSPREEKSSAGTDKLLAEPGRAPPGRESTRDQRAEKTRAPPSSQAARSLHGREGMRMQRGWYMRPFPPRPHHTHLRSALRQLTRPGEQGTSAPATWSGPTSAGPVRLSPRIHSWPYTQGNCLASAFPWAAPVRKSKSALHTSITRLCSPPRPNGCLPRSLPPDPSNSAGRFTGTPLVAAAPHSPCWLPRRPLVLLGPSDRVCHRNIMSHAGMSTLGPRSPHLLRWPAPPATLIAAS